MKIAVYAIAKNEAQFVQRWAESAKDADVILLADTGSTDGTAQKIGGGVRVEHIRIDPWRFDEARNFALSILPEDIDVCVSLDLDETLQPGWREEIERLWGPEATRLWYKFDWGNGHVFNQHKIHARHGYRWKRAVHEQLEASIPEVYASTDKLLIVQKADETKGRSQYMDLLELARYEDPFDAQIALYYARELSFNERWDEAIKGFEAFLAMPNASWDAERAYAMRTAGWCEVRRGNSGEEWFSRAAKEVPHLRETWCDLADCYYLQGKWEPCLAAAERALGVTDRQFTYVDDVSAWGAKPHYLANIAAWNLGRFAEARLHALDALELEPNERFLWSNLRASLAA